MRIVVTGKTGQVVTALAEHARKQEITFVAVGRPEFDLADPQKGLSAIADAKPDVIVSAAAYTAVDKAESDVDAAQVANANAPGALAKLAASLAVPLVHLSTDYVFDGAKSIPYVEEDKANPLSVYGQTKFAGELAVAAATQNHAILRTAWLYSPFGANFLKTMLRLGTAQRRVSVVADQIGNPTSALDIAEAVMTVARNLCDRPDDQALRGVFHVTGSGEASWADFAEEIFAYSAGLGGPSASVARITTADYPTLAKRPTNSRLYCDKLRHLHGIIMPDWRSSTHATLARLLDPQA